REASGTDAAIGISFYTFQTITYIVDVYRDKAPVQKNFGYLLLYVSMFPQLIAGPIVKYVDIEAQIRKRTLHGKEVGEGVLRFLVGLFKKAVLANVAGEVAATFLDGDLSNLSVLGAWLGILSYTLQIYFDFSAYSDMAIGLGRMFGFKYKENFNYPYIANSITDFWRRWHISLTTFFREYLYIPLGGNRKHQVLNLFIVWALTGFWHGAAWNFIAWGLYYFVLIMAEKLFLGKALEKIPRVFGHIYALLFVILGWGLFYFDDMTRLRQFFSVLFGFGASAGATAGDVSILLNHLLFFLFAIVACLPVSRYIKERYIAFGRSSIPNSKLADAGLVMFAAVMLFVNTAAIVGSTYNPFLYFRF
ncbi:MAG: MBOAT family protein, partial [Clostridia bacterium]|nr:MBOAT family protein [Clostridia bacterium]